MNATERAALLQSAALFDELHTAVDERTLKILDRRRNAAVIRRRGWLVRRALLVADMLGLAMAFLLAETFHPPSVNGVGLTAEYALFLLTLPLWVVMAKLYGLYDHDEERADNSTIYDLVPVFHLVTVGAWIFFAAAWVLGFAPPNLPKLLIFWAAAVGLIWLSRGVARGLCRRSMIYLQNTLIVGAGEVGQLVARKFIQHPEYGINLVGFVDDDPRESHPDVAHVAHLGGHERLPGLVRLFDIERVVIAFSNEPHEGTLDLIRSVKDLDVQVDIVPRLFEVVGPAVSIHSIEGMPLVGLPRLSLSRSSALFKRTLDLGLGGLALAVLAPLLALIALAVKLTSPGPVLFRQVRMGSGEQTFEILKFRTMNADAETQKHTVAHLNDHLRPGRDARMFKIAGDPRVTRLGTFLRRYSLDELPQLWNVLRGEMSLVGPRPLILDEDQFVDHWGRQRLDLKPGITGPWQVLGRNDIPFQEMVRLDYLYVTNWSIWTDLALILRTAPVVVYGRGK
jgi:exopolysaccharide biosynthesis polyprenyl glycosylphosphotransferase